MMNIVCVYNLAKKSAPNVFILQHISFFHYTVNLGTEVLLYTVKGKELKIRCNECDFHTYSLKQKKTPNVAKDTIS